MKVEHRRMFYAAMALQDLTFEKIGAKFNRSPQTVCNVCAEPPRRRNPDIEDFISGLIGLQRNEVFPLSKSE
jgi:hypothetical protein